jgi:hypothetical protein
VLIDQPIIRFKVRAGDRLNWSYCSILRRLLTICNAIDRTMFATNFLNPFRLFVLTYGEKS